jgi:Fe2+ or Zn2+ uptake regulation protein
MTSDARPRVTVLAGFSIAVTDAVRFDSYIAVVPAASFLDDLATTDELRDRGMHAADNDHRGVADVVVRQVEFADTVVVWSNPEMDALESGRLTALLRRLAPWAAHVQAGDRQTVDCTALAARLLRTGRHDPAVPGMPGRALEGYPVHRPRPRRRGDGRPAPEVPADRLGDRRRHGDLDRPTGSVRRLLPSRRPPRRGRQLLTGRCTGAGTLSATVVIFYSGEDDNGYRFEPVVRVTESGRPHRQTRHRAEIGALLRETTEFLSAQRIYLLLRERGIPIGLTTVYRILQGFAEDGVADTARTATGEQVYRHCSPSHHHHLMCRSCARAVEIEGPVIETWAAAVAKDHGFRDVNHSLEIFGTCRHCAADKPIGP